MKKKLPLSSFQKNSINAQQANQLKGGIIYNSGNSSLIGTLTQSVKYITWGEVDIRTGGDTSTGGTDLSSISFKR